MGFSGGMVVKNPSANAGDARDMGSIPVLGTFPGVIPHSSILAWKIPWTEDTTEHTHPHTPTHTWMYIYSYTYMEMHTHTHTIHTYTYMDINIYICTDIHMVYIHTYIMIFLNL